MIYRRLPVTPPRMLLRVVAPAGALASLLACSSSSAVGSVEVHGTVGEPVDGGGDAFATEVTGVAPSSSGGATGLMDAGILANPDSGFHGTVAYPTDASPEGGDAAGVVEAEEGGPCGGNPCGVIVRPDAG
jgi:hypothetical protein